MQQRSLEKVQRTASDDSPSLCVPQVTHEALSRTLAQVRPWSLMVVVANEDDYVDDILNLSASEHLPPRSRAQALACA